MAYINVASWTPDQVTDWLKGLDDSMYNYVHSFTNNEVNGQKLLNIRPYELEQLGMASIGHQEIILEAVENLRNFHYNLDKENLQFLALQVASASQNLFRQLTHYCDKSKIETQILNDITRTIATIKPLVAWLERAPFKGHVQFNEIRKNILRLGLEMATMAQRDRFVENPVDQIHATAKKLAKLADYIIQDITDPMLLQPAALNLVTLKKRESELGFNLVPSYHGIHRVTEIKYNSPAHTSGKIEDGDEIVQINYQTVVGWQYKTVILHLRESPPDVLLTLKKRPKHTKIYGQIYMQPYRLPSKKRALTTRWGDNLPSPRANFLAVPDFNLPFKITEKSATNSSDTDSSCSDDILTPTDPKSADKEIRMYYPKPRAVLQRRNTICGDELSYFKNVTVPLWHERKTGGIQSGDPSSPSLRDKSVSFGFGLEIAPRPTTCIGITGNGGKYNELVGLNNSLPEITKEKDKLTKQKENENGCDIIRKTQNSNNEANSKPGVCKVVRFGSNMKIDDYPVDNKYICNVENTILETFEPIPYADDEDDSSQEAETPKIPIEISSRIFSFEKEARAAPNVHSVITNNRIGQNLKIEPDLCQAINTALLNRRGRLDKSHSTPTYDNSGEESDTPPAIEPRKEFLLTTPPLPPPRPRKQAESLQVPIPPPKPQNLSQNLQIQMLHSATAVTPSIITTNTIPISTTSPPVIPPHRPIHILHKQEATVSPTSPEHSDFELPVKTKGLTLKKKNSLMAKRRKINLKLIGTGDIQGHLYRRTKDKRGVTYWAKLYFVLIETVLYGFRTKDALKANCMIFLPGFTVSLAEEVHSKPFAFKVYHAAKTFYFAAESAIALNQWMDFIKKAALKESQQTQQQQGYDDINPKELYSETDSSGDESSATKQLCTPSPITTPTSTRDILNSQSKSNCNETPTTSKSDNKYLGSLKKLTKTSLNFKHSSNIGTGNNSNDKKKSSDIPEPTEQFRTFRKKPGGSFGVQIGAGVSITSSYLDNNYSPQPQLNSPHQNQIQHFFPPEQTPRKLSLTISTTQNLTSKEENRWDEPSSTPGTPKPISENDSQILPNCTDKEPKKLKKPSPHSFIHASNPNLIEFDQMSKTLEMPKMNSSNSWDTHNNLQGFQGLTLKDLMLQKQEEEAQDMYNNRVLLGVEKKDKAQRNPSNISKSSSNFENNEHGNIIMATFNKSRIQMRSLPKTPDYEMSFKLDDEDIKRTRTKEGLKLRDFGYELIPGDEPTTLNVNDNSSSNNVNEHHTKKHKILTTYHATNVGHNTGLTVSNKKKYSVSNASDHHEKSSRGGSFKKHIGKFEAFKSSSEKIFQFKHNSDDLKNLKAVTSYTPMTLPLNKKSSHLYNIQVQDQQNKIKKSQTYNNEFKEIKRVTEEKSHHRKNSAPMPILSKFQFSSAAKTTKEKKLLGSPRLHRAIFGRSSNRIEQDYDHEIFCPITFTKAPSNPPIVDSVANITPISNTENQANTSVEIINQQNSTVAPITPIQKQQQQPSQIQSPQPSVQTPEYPNLECPPVFEPETYSLSDPNASLTLLRRRNTFEENA
ncbi:uncharacterized protein LOC129607851 [Condylostylus longicornis]|uniref:uncharacterized protein LOC129607851 n=1 Tax=Condylostylus longicornis TaxID=2530218 RepID=UPI00244DF29E|nr:uncharacterized protein LOC129607851 [Condylostylus longicornis]